ncbi:hypothetical protein P171DRAFT_526099 [Karstenula rhodostoma CBS 690.94]|uniref:Uncharacterized protein n=1 Tax=Karstenula rhodostoma CBS 690.94 TaxID=1392251 RepID=A0A9P4P7S2_9PLEO|nr:hypothetical protein P171DRAFT_526099 [Karstenula rhodostoma CBS 690.94]
MATIDRKLRHSPCHILRDHNIPCVVWFEDAIAYYGVPTVLFDLYILVPDIETATQVLISDGWDLVPQEKGKIGNADVDYPQRRLTPPSQYSHKAELPAPHASTPQSPRPLPPPDTSPPRPTTTVLLPVADWNFSLAGLGANNTKNLVDTIYPPLAGLVDALIDSLLDCPSDNYMLYSHLSVQIAYLYGWSPLLKEKGFAEQLMYEHRQYHLDVLCGMDHATWPFISHQRKIREALRNGTHKLQECSAARSNESLFSREVQAKLLASMPDPFAHTEEDRKDGGGWEMFDNPNENGGIPNSYTKPDEFESPVSSTLNENADKEAITTAASFSTDFIPLYD